MATWRRTDGRWEIQGAERGIRFHKIRPEWWTQKDAKEFEREIRRNISHAKDLKRAPKVSIGEGIMRYLKEFHGKSGLAQESHAKALAPFVIGKTLSKIVEVSDKVRSTRSGGSGKKLSNSTINRRLAILKTVARQSYRRWGWLNEPLHEKIELLPENPSRQVYLTRDQLAELVLNIPQKEYRRIVLMAAFTGMRRSELLSLKPHDICGGVASLRDTKISSPRNVPIHRTIRWAFRRLPLRVDPSRLSKSVQKASGNKVRFHDLRHTAASFLANAGVPRHVVGAILGHTSEQTTKRYSHLYTQTLEDAMELMRPSRKSPAAENGKNKNAA